MIGVSFQDQLDGALRRTRGDKQFGYPCARASRSEESWGVHSSLHIEEALPLHPGRLVGRATLPIPASLLERRHVAGGTPDNVREGAIVIALASTCTHRRLLALSVRTRSARSSMLFRSDPTPAHSRTCREASSAEQKIMACPDGMATKPAILTPINAIEVHPPLPAISVRPSRGAAISIGYWIGLGLRWQTFFITSPRLIIALSL